MNAQTVLERVGQKPFRAFALETIGGTWLDVDRETDVLVYDRFKPIRIIIFDAGGRLYILEPEQISTLESK